MKYLAYLAAFIPNILAEPIGYDFKVNPLTLIPDLVMTAPNSAPISFDSASDHKVHDGITLNVVGYMTFTETEVPQTYNIKTEEWAGILELAMINPAGLKEADVAVLSNDPGQPKGIITGWVTDDIPPEFNVTTFGDIDYNVKV